jgi:glycosyltransferase involved in cell wall biosynthesis
MRIALVITAFFDSSLSLYKHLYENCDIDLYCFVYDRFLTNPAFDLSGNQFKTKDPVELIPDSCLPYPVLKYLDGAKKSTRTYVYKITMSSYLRLTYLAKKIVVPENYDLIHFIGSSLIYDSFLRSRSRSYKVIVSLHEADPYRIKRNSFHPKESIKWVQNKLTFSLINKADYITFFSDNERIKFVGKFPQSAGKCGIIKFGLFEIFSHYELHPCMNRPLHNYILYVGLIRPYKGVNFLIESIRKSGILSETDFVIAGKDEIGLDNISMRNIKIINKFLTEAEINYLVINSKAVILPYTSSSQSGIPSISLMYGKPLIFSNVKGLDEYLKDGYNGIEFRSGESKSLESAILKIGDKKIYDSLVKNIKNNPYPEDLSWKAIAQKFIALYKIILKK